MVVTYISENKLSKDKGGIRQMHATHSVGLFGLGWHTCKAIHTPTIYAGYSFQDIR